MSKPPKDEPVAFEGFIGEPVVYAIEHGIDLSDWHTAVGELRKIGRSDPAKYQVVLSEEDQLRMFGGFK